MQISSLVFYLYKRNNHRGWALDWAFSMSAPLAVTMNWKSLQDNDYALIRRLDINQTLPVKPKN